ncbi:MAG TPA: hypothetical protein VN110_01505, partial [Sphingobium sp.]|nr:hypothetical protein [Sphingobium sp.]
MGDRDDSGAGKAGKETGKGQVDRGLARPDDKVGDRRSGVGFHADEHGSDAADRSDTKAETALGRNLPPLRLHVPEP